MTADEPVEDPTSADSTTSWRDLAVARSLDPARARAEKRVQRFLDAALELMETSDGKDFTLQEVIEKSGQSLRSFYQYFAGKHELLLALFEDSVRSTAEHLGGLIDDDADPRERLRQFTTEYCKMCQPSPRKVPAKKKAPSAAMADFAQQLLTEYPKEASQAFVPLMQLLTELLDDAAAAGAIRSNLDRGQLAGILLQSIMFNAFASTISGAPVSADAAGAADDLWDFLLTGIGNPTPAGRHDD